jgi:hypothetical protein
LKYLSLINRCGITTAVAVVVIAAAVVVAVPVDHA